MKQTKRLLMTAAEVVDLPADIVAGIPRMEMTGNTRFSIEPHKGLLEYSEEMVSVDSAIGRVVICGSGLDIHQMNRSRISISGTIREIKLEV